MYRYTSSFVRAPIVDPEPEPEPLDDPEFPEPDPLFELFCPPLMFAPADFEPNAFCDPVEEVSALLEPDELAEELVDEWDELVTVPCALAFPNESV